MKKIIAFLFSCTIVLCPGQATDSLRKLVVNDKEDTLKVVHLNQLAKAYLGMENLDSTLYFSEQALPLAKKLGFKKGAAIAYHNRGHVYFSVGDYPKTLENWQAALKLDEELKDKKGIAKRLGNIGSVYKMQSDYDKALEYYTKALKIGEELKEDVIITKNLGNMGVVYDDKGDYPKALDHYFKALRIDEKLGNKSSIAIWLGNIGIVYQEQKDYPKSLDYSQRALKIDEETKNKYGMALRLTNIGNTYNLMNDLGKALNYYERSLKLSEEIGDKQGLSRNYGNIGVVYRTWANDSTKSTAYREEHCRRALENLNKGLHIDEEIGNMNGVARAYANIGNLYIVKKNYSAAERSLLQAGKLFKEMGALDFERQYEEAIGNLYAQTGKPQLALQHLRRTMILKDSIFNIEKDKELTRKEMNYEFEKKEASAKAEQEKKDAVAGAEARKQRFILILVSCVLSLVALTAFVIFRSLRVTRKQKHMIEQQKELVEEKQKEILDSIYYARRIQSSLMPREKYIQKSLSRLQKNN